MDIARFVSDPRLLHGTSAVNVTAGVIGGPGGVANDTRLVQVVILLNAAAVTLTIVGFRDETGAARNVVLTGSTSADTVYNFPGLKNSAGAMTLTASVADKVLVSVTPG